MTSSSSAIPLSQVPRRYSRARLGIVRGAEAAARLGGGRTLYRRRHLRAGRFVVRREKLVVDGLHGDLEGLRCVHLSDLHAGPFLGGGDLADVVEACNAESPTLVFITGDLITHSWTDALLVLEDLAHLQAQLGLLAVFGNHDYHGREEGRIAEAYGQRGIHFLRNEARRFERGGAAVAVVGLEDLEEGKVVDLAAARRSVRPGDLELALCHHPTGALALARPGCAAVFSGHTHGGQLDLPWVRRHGPPHPGIRLRLGPTTLLVHRGLGSVGLPMRGANAPSEIIVADFTGRSG